MEFVIDNTKEGQKDFFSRMPRLLYKYRCWTDSYHRKVLNDRELFLSSPSRFNDPYDLALPFRQLPEDLDPIVIKRKLETTVVRRFPELRMRADLLEDECAKQLMLIQQSPAEWFQENWGFKPEELNRLFGVISLTPHPDNFLMWSHYANSHKGFCIGFETESLVRQAKGAFKAVDYTNYIPIISYNDHEKELMDKLIYTKSTAWQYEDEYRITKIYGADTKLTFSYDAINCIYLGVKMTQEIKMEIIDTVSKLCPHVKVYEMQLHKEKFQLQSMRVF